MKFIICAVVLNTLAVNAQFFPSLLLFSAPNRSGISVLNSHPIAIPAIPAIPASTHLYSAPPFVPSSVGLNTEGIAKTPGSDYITSLPGHVNSASLINLEHAPGNIKVENQDSLTVLPSVAVHSSGIPAVLPLSISPLYVQAPLVRTQSTYVAKSLGAEHIAPLPGHLISASAINLEQAPGTNKDSNTDLPSVAVHGSVIPAALPFNISPFIVPAPLVVPADATYVAKNLGVEHIAPLPGHTISATSLNLEPAPGSK